MSKENNEQTQGVPAGPYTVEKHGDGFAIYTGRTPFHRGMNWGQLTECSEALATAVERGLNMLSAAPQAQPVEAEQATVVMHEPVAVVVTWRVPGGTETGVEWMDAPPPDGTKLYVSAQPVREPMSFEQFVAACEREYGEDFYVDEAMNLDADEKQETIRVARLVERHHGICKE